MAEIPQGYHDVPEADRKKAQVFFDRGKTIADTGNYEYAIEMYLQGLALDPEAIEAHQAIRDISLKRKATGGKSLGFIESIKLRRKGKDDRQSMLNAEKLLAYDPGHTDHMLALLQSAFAGGYYDTVMWIGPVLLRANADSVKPPPDFNKFIALKNIYKELQQWKRATEAAQYAAMLRPDDMELGTELKNLGAQDTMAAGRYSEGGSFRDSVRDAARQHELMEGERDVHNADFLTRAIQQAEQEYAADPTKLPKLIEALEKTEAKPQEDRAVELLMKEYEQTRQFRWRLGVGRIRLKQLARQDRALRADLRKSPDDVDLQNEYREFVQQRTETELQEFALAGEHYPTDMGYRFEQAKRLFALQRYNESIPLLQQARNDPKLRTNAAIYLGRAFLESGFVDESSDTLRQTIEEYQIKGDERSKDMYYWYARALEANKDMATALKSYSQVAQWDFNYRDVQNRIKRLRQTSQDTAGQDTANSQ